MRRGGANAVIEAYENGYERKALVVIATGTASRAPYNELAPSGPDVLFEDDRVIKPFGILRTIEDRAGVS